jgi:hypothetical protein
LVLLEEGCGGGGEQTGELLDEGAAWEDAAAAGGPRRLGTLGVDVAQEGDDREGVERRIGPERAHGLGPGEPGAVRVHEDQSGAAAGRGDEVGRTSDRADLHLGAAGCLPDTAQEEEVVHEGEDARHGRDSIAIMSGSEEDSCRR